MVSKDSTDSCSTTTSIKTRNCMMTNSQKGGKDPRGHSDVGRRSHHSEVSANGIIETAMNEQTCNIRSVSNPQNLNEMQYLHHEAEDSLIDASLSMDKSSLMGFIDSSNLESSEDVHTVPCIQVDIRTDVVLIDEDDDDMSLRERTVTDVSTTDGNAAELVCGRLQSISSDSSHSLCEAQDMETPQEEQETHRKHKRSCCLCVII